MVGTGMLNPSVSQVALSSVPPEQSGLAAGANDMFRQAGIAVGVAALGALVTGGETYVDGFHTALWAGAAVALGRRSRPRCCSAPRAPPWRPSRPLPSSAVEARAPGVAEQDACLAAAPRNAHDVGVGGVVRRLGVVAADHEPPVAAEGARRLRQRGSAVRRRVSG